MVPYYYCHYYDDDYFQVGLCCVSFVCFSFCTCGYFFFLKKRMKTMNDHMNFIEHRVTQSQYSKVCPESGNAFPRLNLSPSRIWCSQYQPREKMNYEISVVCAISTHQSSKIKIK